MLKIEKQGVADKINIINKEWVRKEKDYNTCNMITLQPAKYEVIREEKWCFDNGCSKHMTGNFNM